MKRSRMARSGSVASIASIAARSGIPLMVSRSSVVLEGSPPQARPLGVAVLISVMSEPGAHRPELRKQHDLKHLLEIRSARRAAGAAFQADYALDRGDVVEAPA